jgi:hypothetical protein
MTTNTNGAPDGNGTSNGDRQTNLVVGLSIPQSQGKNVGARVGLIWIFYPDPLLTVF